ncbi:MULTISPECIES: HAD-IA family hydrolase [unclassified Novosphingobium]|uniref:HAD-IA family hydrolase n=1 Tax=unclassified Novosphingobium TaxID=2644732 RepID=UPI00061BF870|nr:MULTISPECIES: HAD-IA family hydrolase [unclassified Novosphingobium]GAO54180.1 hydrolase of haloacid dehalogenase-like family [Novosphingobium sp. MD-1]
MSQQDDAPVDAPVDGAIDAVVWDIGRVLVQWRIASLYEKLIADPRELDWFLANVVTEEWHAQHDAGVPLAEMIAARSAEFPAYRPLIEAYAPNWLDAVPGPVTGTHELVRALDARGIPQFSITNFGADTWAMFRPTFPVLDHFRDIVVSGVEKLIKPDAAIFALAARRFGHEPARMLFIDDNAANIAAADALGWHTHHFRDDAAALRADLEARGLL